MTFRDLSLARNKSALNLTEAVTRTSREFGRIARMSCVMNNNYNKAPRECKV